jgi:hypothetical protein
MQSPVLRRQAQAGGLPQVFEAVGTRIGRNRDPKGNTTTNNNYKLPQINAQTNGIVRDTV